MLPAVREGRILSIKMRIRAKYAGGVLRPDRPLPFLEGQEVELTTVPDLRDWVGVLSNPPKAGSVETQHQAPLDWAAKHVPR